MGMVAEPTHIRLGRIGEEAAARYIARQGWNLSDRNWRPDGRERGLELDIVARHGDTLVFVEVKTRSRTPKSNTRPGTTVPVWAALTAQKQARLARAAACYLSATAAWHLPCRFDLICIEQNADKALTLEHYKNVIELGHLVDCGHTTWQPW